MFVLYNLLFFFKTSRFVKCDKMHACSCILSSNNSRTVIRMTIKVIITGWPLGCKSCESCKCCKKMVDFEKKSCKSCKIIYIFNHQAAKAAFLSNTIKGYFFPGYCNNIPQIFLKLCLKLQSLASWEAQFSEYFSAAHNHGGTAVGEGGGESREWGGG